MTCEATVTHLGGRSALAEARLTDAGGKLYASATSSCMIFRPAAAPTATSARVATTAAPASG
jgi:acyl-coenzyme A thioesterase PaaI-like protein